MKRPQPQLDRPKQAIPAQILADLMAVIRNQFYPDALAGGDAAKQWFQDQQFLKVRVVLWPAAWLNKRGVSLQPDRYQQILLDIFKEIKRHGATGAVKFWPGYLAKCVQDHFRHHEDEIYEEGKVLRIHLERAMATAQAAAGASQPDPVDRLAEFQRMLSSTARKRRCKPAAQQLEFL
jgi:hypothetical protein